MGSKAFINPSFDSAHGKSPVYPSGEMPALTLQFVVSIACVLMLMLATRMWPRNDGTRFRPEYLIFGLLILWAVANPVIGVVTKLPWWFYTVVSIFGGLMLFGVALTSAHFLLRNGLRDLDEFASMWVVAAGSYIVLFPICAAMRWLVRYFNLVENVGFSPGSKLDKWFGG